MCGEFNLCFKSGNGAVPTATLRVAIYFNVVQEGLLYVAYTGLSSRRGKRHATVSLHGMAVHTPQHSLNMAGEGHDGEQPSPECCFFHWIFFKLLSRVFKLCSHKHLNSSDAGLLQWIMMVTLPIMTDQPTNPSLPFQHAPEGEDWMCSGALAWFMGVIGKDSCHHVWTECHHRTFPELFVECKSM